MNLSVYERLGGEDAVHRAVEVFYGKVTADERICFFFEGLDMQRQSRKLTAFLTYAFGGPSKYTGNSLRAVHARLVAQGLNEQHFAAMMEDLRDTLAECAIPEDLSEEIMAISESTRDDVLCRRPVADADGQLSNHISTLGGFMKRIAVFAYGVVCYALFFATFLYACGFVGNILVPKSIDSGPQGPLGSALLVNTLLLGLFAVQHSVMARPGFKKAWTRLVPEPIERSTFVLFASLALILLFWQWRPMGGFLWNVEDTVGRAVLYGLFALGWLMVLIATFLINHFDLFGLRQVTLYLQKKPYTRLRFQTPGLYRYVRHPLYLGFILGFWATPAMTIGHLIFALATTGYILIAIQLEERDLEDLLGHSYSEYRRRVPMLIPYPTQGDATREGAEHA